MTQEFDHKTKDDRIKDQTEETSEDMKQKRVCLYSVVDEEAIEQRNDSLSEQLAVIQLINNTPNWKYERLYMDPVGEHASFDEMIADCKRGKYDIIVTKTFRCFAKTLCDTLNIAIYLADMDPPVEIIFTDEAIFTLDSDKMEDLKLMITDTCKVQKQIYRKGMPLPAFSRVGNSIDTNAEEGE